MAEQGYDHRVVSSIEFEPGADQRAPGGAVTVELCGHWDHPGPCRWPHYTSVESNGADQYRVCVEFDAPGDEVDEVRERIIRALKSGEQAGPDGHVSRWNVVD